MNPLEHLQRIAEVEFASIVVQTDFMGAKMRGLLTDGSYVDVWASRKSVDRFGFYWERRHLDGRVYRYDNFPDTEWSSVATFPCHFHDSDQATVVASPFSTDLESAFREFMAFVQRAM